MKDLPAVVLRKNLSFCWTYRDRDGNEIALVTRYDEGNGSSKKKFHQYRVGDDGQWIEGAPTPLPLYGLDSLPKSDSNKKIYVFEGEKCTTAAHHLGLSALTSMMGSCQAQYGDWSILAQYRHVTEFILIPDNDAPGRKYIETVYQEIKKACPNAKIFICELVGKDKGDDLVDWIQQNPNAPPEWDGFGQIDEPYSEYLLLAFEAYVSSNCVEADIYFQENTDITPTFDDDPEAINEVLSEVLPCPLDTLPPGIVDWIRGHADQMQVAEDALAAPLIVYMGSLIGRKRGLRLRQGSNWIEYPNLWGMLVGRPSMMKSPSMKAVRRPLEVLADHASKEHKLALKKHENDVLCWKIRKKVAEDNYKDEFKKFAGKKGPNPVEANIEEEPIQPKMRRYKTEDATTEKLGELLIDNPQGLLLFRDELSGWLNSFEKNGREGDRQFFLESWSGDEEFDVDRIGRGSLHIPALCLSIFGSIQPGPLSQYVRSAVQGGIGDDGFIQRFQVMVWPDPKDSWELVEGINISSLEAPIYRVFEYLNDLKFNHEGKPEILSFTDEAQKLFNEWQGDFEKRLRSGNLPPHLEAHLTKYKKLLPALCIIFAHLKEAIEGRYPESISAQALQIALQWLDYFESHARRVYESGKNTVPKAAKELIARIKKGEVQVPFSIRDVYYSNHWSGLATANQVEEVVEYLQEKYYLAGKIIKTTGRPTEKFWPNPKIFEEA